MEATTEPPTIRRTSLVVEASTPGAFRHRRLSVVVTRVTAYDPWTLVAASVNAIAVELAFAEYRKHGREVCIVGAAEQQGVMLRVSDRHSRPWHLGEKPPTEPFLPAE